MDSRLVGDGLIASYMRYVEPHEAPSMMHLVSLMTMFSAAVERRLTIRRGYNLRANIYSLLVGPPATRKTTAMRIAREMMEEAGMETVVLGGNVSDEGVLTELQELEKEGGSGAGLLYAEEFGILVEGKKYKEGVLRFLIRAYDGRDVKNLRRGDGRGPAVRYGVDDIYLSLLGATTYADLRELPSSTLKTGLVSRTWIVAAQGPEKRVYRPKFDMGLRKKIVEQLRRRLGQMGDALVYDPGKEADEEMEVWYMGPHTEESSHATEDEQGWYGRRHDHAMKAAVLMALMDQGPDEALGASGVRRGISLMEAIEPGAFATYGAVGRTVWSTKRESFLDRLRKNKGTMGMRQLKAATGHLFERGEVEMMVMELRRGELIEVSGETVRLLE